MPTPSTTGALRATPKATWRARCRILHEAIRLKPDYADAFNNRGNARSAKGDVEGALQDYNEAIRLKPDYADAFNNRGNVRCAKGDLEGALQDYSEAIRLKPDYAEAFYNRGVARYAKRDVVGALHDLIEAIRLGYKPKNLAGRFISTALNLSRFIKGKF